MSPKGDRILAATAGGVTTWTFDQGHPDATLAALFLPVWYEGEPQPRQVWQTSGGEGFEPKLGLTPLVFGTLKATCYSMLFGAPLALLAALYTSEFLHPKQSRPHQTDDRIDGQLAERRAGVPGWACVCTGARPHSAGDAARH